MPRVLTSMRVSRETLERFNAFRAAGRFDHADQALAALLDAHARNPNAVAGVLRARTESAIEHLAALSNPGGVQ